MSGDRPGARLLPLAAASAAASVCYGLCVRPRLLTWGASRDEAARTYPGDEIVPVADSSSTMATTLPAPPEQVWPWLVQMGGDRAGWYSWDWLDHFGRPSADRVAPEWQTLEVGQRLNTAPDGRSWFTVAVLEPHRTLVLRSDVRVLSGRSFDPQTGFPPRARLDGVWGFHLRAADGGASTRLVVRTRGTGRPRTFNWLLGVLFGEPAHFIMQTRQFQNLRTRVGTSG